MEHPPETHGPWLQPGPPTHRPKPHRPDRPARKSWLFGITGLVIGLAVGAIAGQLSAGSMSTSAEGQQTESAQLITDAVATCDVADSLGVNVMDEGASLQLSTTGKEAAGASYTDVICVLEELDVPDSVVARFGATRALDGQQTADWNGFSASWGYHPDTGLDVVVGPRAQD